MLGRQTLLVNPPPINGVAFTRQGRCQEREEVLGTTKPPYSLALIASLLRDAGCDVRLIDMTAERLTVHRSWRPRARVVQPNVDSLPQHDANARRRRRRDGGAQDALRRADVLLRSARLNRAAGLDAARTSRGRHVRRRARRRRAAARAPGARRRSRVDREPHVPARRLDRPAPRPRLVRGLHADAVSGVGPRSAPILLRCRSSTGRT